MNKKAINFYMLVFFITPVLLLSCRKKNNAQTIIAEATITIDTSVQFQKIDGFGGFGAQMEYWGNGPFTSAEYVNTLINDLGVTILRDNIPSNFEVENDNNDPLTTDLSKYNIDNNTPGHDGKLRDHLQFLKDMKTAGLQKLIVSVWTPATWMKYNNKIGNGTENQNQAPPYTRQPDGNTNQLKTDMYEEFVEMCVAYIKIIKRETGLDVYALSLQNEPRFSQYYSSCVYDGPALRDLIKIAGARFKAEGISTKLFMPEDIGWTDAIEEMVEPALEDAVARNYAGIIAVHGYDLDGLTANSPDAQTWQKIYSWGAPYKKPLWMTETSGYLNDWSGAMSLARAIFTALKHGNVSAWLYWTISTTKLDEYSLMSANGIKSKRFYASKQFYKFVRPGALRVSAEISNEATIKVYPIAFYDPNEKATSVIILNDDTTKEKRIKMSGKGIPSQMDMYITSKEDNCILHGKINRDDIISIPPGCIITLYGITI